MKKKISLVLVLALCMVAGVAKADFTFGTPTNLGPTINTSSVEAVPDISADDLSLIFASDRSGGDDLWVATRTSTEDDWRTPVNLGPTVNSTYSEASISISADGLTLFFDDYPSPRPGGVGGVDIWVATRPTVSNSWGTPVNLGWPFNSERLDGGPSISADGLALFLYSSRPGGYGSNDIWVARRPTTSDPWSTPVNLGPPVNSSAGECCPSISADGRMLFFGSDRGGSAGYDLWVTTRASVSDPWGPPVNLGATVNSSTSDDGPSISADGSTLYFMSNRPGGYGNYDLWQAPIIPIVDFNGDFKVDIEDLIILINNWGTSESLCDIGPMPCGDGVVDEADLEVLMNYWGQEILPLELIEYWKLDEAEGDIAYNSIGDNYGILSGDPTWQPGSGQVAGTLEFDGIDDYVETDFVLNPADGAFSVFAWIKGGAARTGDYLPVGWHWNR